MERSGGVQIDGTNSQLKIRTRHSMRMGEFFAKAFQIKTSNKGRTEDYGYVLFEDEEMQTG